MTSAPTLVLVPSERQRLSSECNRNSSAALEPTGQPGLEVGALPHRRHLGVEGGLGPDSQTNRSIGSWGAELKSMINSGLWGSALIGHYPFLIEWGIHHLFQGVAWHGKAWGWCPRETGGTVIPEEET